MQILDFSTIDLGIFSTVLISVVIGIARGATRELMSLVSWFGSALLTVLLFPHVKEIARNNISHGLIADFITACVLFVLFLTLLSVLNYACSNFVKKSAFSGVDRFLGGIFGLIRGILLVAVVDIAICQWFVTGSQEPEWLQASRLRPQIMKISNCVILLLPESIQDVLVKKMSLVNKGNLLRFLKKEVIGEAGEVVEESLIKGEAKISTEEEKTVSTLPLDETTVDQKQEEEAKKLATLTTKVATEEATNNSIQENAKKTEKEKLDIKRVLDTANLEASAQ